MKDEIVGMAKAAEIAGVANTTSIRRSLQNAGVTLIQFPGGRALGVRLADLQAHIEKHGRDGRLARGGSRKRTPVKATRKHKQAGA